MGRENEDAGEISRLLLKVFKRLSALYGPQKCMLDHRNALELMIATILSAQCTDKTVNKICAELFKKYKTVDDFADAKIKKFEKDIRSAGFYRMKTANIINSCKIIRDKFDGRVPATMEALCSLPGIGRKTANVVLGNAFNIPGFPVDTHVTRLSQRIGLVPEGMEDPVKIELYITERMPEKYWTEFSHLLISHGRNRCMARKPDCGNCKIKSLCDYYNKNKDTK